MVRINVTENSKKRNVKQKEYFTLIKSYKPPRRYYIHPTFWIKHHNIKMCKVESVIKKSN